MSMFGKLAHLVHPGAQAASARHPRLAEIAGLLPPGAVRGADLETRLAPALASAISYFDCQIAAIPGPFVLAPAPFVTDGLLSAVFAEPGDIPVALGESMEVRESLPGLAASARQEVHALLGMRLKGDFGEGEPPVFVDHTLRSLAPALADTRHYLRLVAFDRLLKSFREQVDSRRSQDREDRSCRARGSDEFRLLGAGEGLDPDHVLHDLIAWLHAPEQHLRIVPNAVRWQCGGGPHGLPALQSADRRQWFICLVRFPTEAGLAALARGLRAHRYILI